MTKTRDKPPECEHARPGGRATARTATLRGGTVEEVMALLPANYSLVGTEADGSVGIVGFDQDGWTLGDYVFPRMASALIYGSETTHTTAIHKHPLNDGSVWYRVTCTCGWAAPDRMKGGPRILRRESAEQAKVGHLIAVRGVLAR